MNNEAIQLEVSQMTPEQKSAMLLALTSEKNKEKAKRKDAYEAIRKDFAKRIKSRVKSEASAIKDLFKFITEESTAFYEIMKEYGALRNEGQLSFTITEDNFKIEVKTNKVKKFDERADLAAERLIEFLKLWISKSDRGSDDAMYQLAMTLLERNNNGDLDYKSISKLYSMEDRFNDTEYSEIMQLFKESNVVEGTATNFYFSEKDELNVWRKIEISFNRL